MKRVGKARGGEPVPVGKIAGRAAGWRCGGSANYPHVLIRVDAFWRFLGHLGWLKNLPVRFLSVFQGFTNRWNCGAGINFGGASSGKS